MTVRSPFHDRRMVERDAEIGTAYSGEPNDSNSLRSPPDDATGRMLCRSEGGVSAGEKGVVHVRMIKAVSPVVSGIHRYDRQRTHSGGWRDPSGGAYVRKTGGSSPSGP
jgi:hypothetical protein